MENTRSINASSLAYQAAVREKVRAAHLSGTSLYHSALLFPFIFRKLEVIPKPASGHGAKTEFLLRVSVTQKPWFD